MAKRIELSDIAITHISLVKSGANGKEFIYKSAADEGGYENVIEIKKQDDELGVVYGIVYSPDEVDSQGDFASAEEILKAAYGFMKSRNTTNVDVDHSFNNENAFVAESWIVKGGDSIFPDEPEGSWAVAIKLESDELKALAKSGDLAGLSMAGKAHRTEVEKADENAGEKAYKNFFEKLAEVTTGMWVDFGTHIQKSKGKTMEEKVEEVAKSFSEIMKEKMEAATKAAGDALAQQDKKIAALQKSSGETKAELDEVKKAHTEVSKENEKLNKENAELKKSLEDQAKEIEALKQGQEDLTKSVQESKQTTPLKKSDKKDDAKGIL